MARRKKQVEEEVSPLRVQRVVRDYIPEGEERTAAEEASLRDRFDGLHLNDTDQVSDDPAPHAGEVHSDVAIAVAMTHQRLQEETERAVEAKPADKLE